MQSQSDTRHDAFRTDFYAGLVRILLETLILATLLFGKPLPIPDLW